MRLLIGIFFLCSALWRSSGQLSIGLQYGVSDTEDAIYCTLMLHVPSDAPVSVALRTVPGTATEGVDYQPFSETLTFLPGQTSIPFIIQLINDSLIEEDETFELEIVAAPPGYELRRFQLRIPDGEKGYWISTRGWEREDRWSLSVFVLRYGDFDVTSTVELVIVPGSARPGIDYTGPQRMTLTFPPGRNVHAWPSIPLVNNRLQDGDRTLSFRLENPSHGVPLFRPAAEGVILDNDSGYYFENAELGISLQGNPYEGANPFAILHRVGSFPASDVTIRFGASEGSPPLRRATPGADFNESRVTVHFEAGQTNAIVPLPILNDDSVEWAEWFLAEHPISVTRPEFIDSQPIAIRDNEFNPLPVSGFCPPFERFAVRSLASAANGKIWALVLVDFRVRLFRLNSDGSLDHTFAPLVPEPTTQKMIPLRDGRFALILGDGTLQSVHIMDAEGSIDQTFQPFADKRIDSVALAPNGKFYVTAIGQNRPMRVFRLHFNGALDESFSSPRFTSYSAATVIVTASGAVYVDNYASIEGESFRSPVRLQPDGAPDPSYRPSEANLLLHECGGSLYARDGLSRLVRLREDGSSDPAFEKLELGDNGVALSDNDGFLAVAHRDAAIIVERFLCDGRKDPAFYRGTIDRTGEVTLAHGKLILRAETGRINGSQTPCFGWASLALRPNAAIRVQPETIFRENVPVGPLHIIRTHHNSSPSERIRYRVRDGTAVNGSDFVVVTEGQFQFSAGESRFQIPIEIIDDSRFEANSIFYLDFLDASGDVMSTSEVSILSDEIGVHLRQLEPGLWEITPVNHQSIATHVVSSPDFILWDGLGVQSSNVPFRHRSIAPHQFFKASKYP